MQYLTSDRTPVDERRAHVTLLRNTSTKEVDEHDTMLPHGEMHDFCMRYARCLHAIVVFTLNE